jgi:hypothetical protein
MIARRGSSKSYSAASMLARMFLCGEDAVSNSKIRGLAIAYQKEYLNRDGLLNKFIDIINFCATHCEFPASRLKDSVNEMSWVSGYKDADTNINKGSENEILGVSVKDNPDKARGKRASKIIYEEMGTFPKFIDTWNVNIPSVQEGDVAFGLCIAQGTGGSEGNDFSGALEMIYNPRGYNVYGVPNVYDMNSKGKTYSVFFFPGYMNTKGYYNEDGVSDVIGALISELKTRHTIKYNSTDPLTLTRRKAEFAFTIQEAIMKRDSTIYPVADLNELLNDFAVNPGMLDSILCGSLCLKDGVVKFLSDHSANPIREFPHSSNKMEGCVEIHALPERDASGKVFSNRYIAGADTYDDDHSETLSLFSVYVLDLWTDKIVAEYTGRPAFADDAYEICRLLTLFYNGRLNYENNKKGLFAYFKRYNSVHLLTEVLDFLKDKSSIKESPYGNKLYGTASTPHVKSYGRTLYRDWLLKPVVDVITKDGEKVEVTVPNLKFLRSKGLIKETAMWNPDGNFDRHDAIIMLMLLRTQCLIQIGDSDFKTGKDYVESDYLGEDPFFKSDPFSNTQTSYFSYR